MTFSTPTHLKIFILAVCFAHLVSSHSHSHHDGHSHDENPSFKYSRQANEHAHREDSPRHASEHHHHHSTEDVPKPKSRDTLTLWIEAIGSTLLISAAPFVILFFIPIDNKAEHKSLLKILLSFASGGLLGDAFLHLIPHALLANSASSGSHSHSHSHDGDQSEVHGHDLSVGLGVLGGIVVFLMVEKFVRIVKGGHGHSHSQPPKEPLKGEGDVGACVLENSEREREDDPCEDALKEKVSETEEEPLTPQTEVADQGPDNDIMVAGYLNLAADFTHNFTDGLAIGASYIAGSGIGLITTMTILLHEVPHEIGDFAILIQSGCSKRKAILLQLLTAVGAIAGTVCSLFAEGMDSRATNLILPFTAGGFIYIATVSVIPDLLEDTKFWQSVKEVIALLVGVYMMVLIAQYE